MLKRIYEKVTGCKTNHKFRIHFPPSVSNNLTFQFRQTNTNCLVTYWYYKGNQADGKYPSA